jgi:hypothetical protein
MQLKSIFFQSDKPKSWHVHFLVLACFSGHFIFGGSEMEAVSGEWSGDLA